MLQYREQFRIVSVFKVSAPTIQRDCPSMPAVVQMWVAAVELLRRGADTSATDKTGRTPLDAAIARMCGEEHVADGALDKTNEAKVQSIRGSFKFSQLPDGRKGSAEEFLLAHLQSEQPTEANACETSANSIQQGE